MSIADGFASNPSTLSLNVTIFSYSSCNFQISSFQCSTNGNEVICFWSQWPCFDKSVKKKNLHFSPKLQIESLCCEGPMLGLWPHFFPESWKQLVFTKLLRFILSDAQANLCLRTWIWSFESKRSSFLSLPCTSWWDVPRVSAKFPTSSSTAWKISFAQQRVVSFFPFCNTDGVFSWAFFFRDGFLQYQVTAPSLAFSLGRRGQCDP